MELEAIEVVNDQHDHAPNIGQQGDRTSNGSGYESVPAADNYRHIPMLLDGNGGVSKLFICY